MDSELDGHLGAGLIARQILGAIPGGAAVAFDRDMRVIFAEGDELSNHGYDVPALVGQLLSDALPERAWDLVKGPYAEALTGRSVEFNIIGEETSHSVTVSPLEDASGVFGGIAVARSIAEKRLSDENLRTSERELRLILDNIPDAVSVQGKDYRYRLVNDAFEERFGVARCEVIGRRDEEVLAPQAIAQDRASYETVFRTGERIQQEEVVPVGGEDHIFQTVKFPLRNEDSEIYGVCGVFKDITDRKRRELELTDRLAWTERIHASLAEDRLVLHGQPIINLRTGESDQAELLVRMQDRRNPHELIPPGAFLPAAERLGLISLIDRWVVVRSLQLAEFHRVEINLSAKTISNPDHVGAIEALVAASTAPRENIVFEITETAVAENLESVRGFAERLREMGCAFALDDFGVGFGTFTYLKYLPVDYLKIDIEFVRDLIRDPTDQQVVSTIVAAAEVFGMKTIAEGVEDEETYEALVEMGVDYAQGYWIGRPMPIHELWATLPSKQS